MNFEYFHGSGAAAKFDLSLSSYETLSVLSRFDDEWLEDLTFKLPVLECLTLCDCKNLRNVKIRSQQLKHLTMERNGYGNVKAIVDSPNLHCFEYEGNFITNFSLRKLLEAEIKFKKPRDYDMDWYINLLEFLSTLNCFEYLSLDVSSEEVINICVLLV